MSRRARLFEGIRSYLHHRAQSRLNAARLRQTKAAATGRHWTGLEALEDRRLLAVVSWDGGGGDGLWSNPLNWDTDALPTPADDVSIVLGPDVTVRYTAAAGDQSVRSVVAHKSISFEGGTLTITNAIPTIPGNSAAAWFTQTLTIDGGSLVVSLDEGVTLDDDIRVSTGDLVLNSGQITGEVAVEGNVDPASITIGSGFTSALTLVTRGFGTTLNGNIAAGQSVTIEGTDPDFFSHAVLTWASGLTNAGTLTLTSASTTSANLQLGANNLINAPTGLIRAVAGTGGARSIEGTGTIIDRGTIETDAGGRLVLIGVNQGSTEAPDWAPLTYELRGGTVDGTVLFNHTHINELVAPTTPSTLTLVGTDNTLVSNNLAGVTLLVLGTGADGTATAVLKFTRPVTTNHGSITLSSSNLDPGAVASSGLDLNAQILVNAPTGRIDVLPGASFGRFIQNGAIHNEGVIEVGQILELQIDSGVMDPATVHHVNSGTIQLTNDVTLTLRGGTFTNQTQGVFTGQGEVDSIGLEFENHGTIRPGASAGTLSFTGNFEQYSDGILEIQLGGTTAGTEHDQIAFDADSVALDGTLSVSTIGSFSPSSADEFSVLTFGPTGSVVVDTSGLTFAGLTELGLNAALLPDTTNPTQLKLSAVGFQNFSGATIQNYAGEAGGSHAVEDGGNTLTLTGDAWRRIEIPIYTFTPNTVLEFDYLSTAQGDFQGIGFDNDDNALNSNGVAFLLYGTESSAGWDAAIDTFRDYAASAPDAKHYRIPVGQFLNGQTQFMTFINDHDVATPTAESSFSNLRLFEDVTNTITLSIDAIDPYTTEDSAGAQVSVENGGKLLRITGNGWKKFDLPLTIGPNTILEFAYQSSTQGELQGIGFDTNDVATDEGSVAFLLYGTEAPAEWTQAVTDFRDYQSTDGFKHYRIPIGEYLTGNVTALTFINDHDAGTQDAESVFLNVRVYDQPFGVIHLDTATVSAYTAEDDASATAAVEDFGNRIRITGNAWKKIDLTYTLTEDTVLEFDYFSTAQGELQGIGFDSNAISNDDGSVAFLLYGTENASTWTQAVTDFRNYSSSAGTLKHYRIPVGQYLTAAVTALTFINDHDAAGQDAESVFANIRLYEDLPGLVDFSSLAVNPYVAEQDTPSATATIEDSGREIQITGNAWKQVAFSYNITIDTVLEFDYQSDTQGELQGIGFDSDTNQLNTGSITFLLYGNQDPGTWDNAVTDFRDYSSSAGALKHYRIPVGQYLAAAVTALTFTNDDDSAPQDAQSIFSNVRVYEDPVEGLVDFDGLALSAYVSGQDAPNTLVEAANTTITIAGNAWKQVPLAYTITPDTVLEFDFASDTQGELQGIGFDSDGDQFNDGSITFLLYGTQDPGNWAHAVTDSRVDYFIGAGTVHYQIRVGDYFLGTVTSLTFVNDDDDATQTARSVYSNIRLYEDPAEDLQDFTGLAVSPYVTGQDAPNTAATVEGGGRKLQIAGNAWKQISFTYTITADTILEFDYLSDIQGELQGIGFDSDGDQLNDGSIAFLLYGTQDPGAWTHAVTDFRDYAASAGTTKHYQIPVGQYLTGSVTALTFINDDDTNPQDAQSVFSNVTIYEGDPSAPQVGLDIVFDYIYDTDNFFSGPNVSRRAILEAAAAVYENRLTNEHFGAIEPSGSNTWSLGFAHPTTGDSVTLENPTLPADTITIYVGARDLPGTNVGLAGYEYNVSGNSLWVDIFNARDNTENFDSFGGSIAFDSLTSWYFDPDPTTLESFPGQTDLFSVAQHEIGHLLGFSDGTAAFLAHISDTTFTGPNVVALHGGPAPLAAADDLGHWQQDLASGSGEVILDPVISTNERKTVSELDFAALKDIGYNVS